MKKIIFVRHGKSRRAVLEMITDFERSLTLKGKNISEQMAMKLKEREKVTLLLSYKSGFQGL